MDEVDSLISVLHDPLKQRQALRKLWSLGDPRAVIPIIDAIGSDSDPDPHSLDYARQALITIGTDAVDPLITALGHENHMLREFAAEVLGSIAEAKAVQPLASTMLEDPNRAVAQAAAEALGKIGNPDAVAPLILALQHPERFVRWSAIAALGEIGDSRAIESLKALLMSNADSEIEPTLRKALDRLGFGKISDS